MAVKPLTDRFIQSVKVSSRDTFKDTKARGLALRVTPSGVKSWSFVYRLPGKKQQWLAMGTYPALSLVKARERAYGYRAAVEAGRDPVAEAKAVKAEAAKPPVAPVREFTFADMAKLYIEEAKSTKKTWAEDEGKLNNYLLPAWADRPIKSITRGDAHTLLDDLKADGMTVGVNRCQALITKIFSVALDRGKIEINPMLRMKKKFKEIPRERALSDAEIRALWQSLDGNESAAADVIRLRLLTGQRGDEVIEMRREEVDLVRATWLIPGSSAKNQRAHLVPLSPTAKAILQRRLDATDQPLIFASAPLNGNDLRKLGDIARNAGYQWRDLRRTCATRLGELGFDDTTIGRVLNHARVTVTSKHYNQHAYTNEKRAALDAWDAELLRIVTTEPQAEAAPVVPFVQAIA